MHQRARPLIGCADAMSAIKLAPMNNADASPRPAPAQREPRMTIMALLAAERREMIA
jgi:hypothetical protein